MKFSPATLGLLCLLTVLPGCVAAIGNTGYAGLYTKGTRSLVEQRVTSATRIVELRQQHLDGLRVQQTAGNVEARAVIEAEIALEEARMVLLDCKAQLEATGKKDRDDD